MRHLPKPDAVYRAPGVRFEVYRAKDLGAPRWRNAALRDVVLQARGSYDVYGKRPRLDAFDAKAAVYLVRDEYAVTTPSGPVQMTSWFSNRFVPNAGTPRGAAELDICMVGETTAEELLRTKHYPDSSTFLEHVLSYSRMCKLGPAPIRPTDERRLTSRARRHPHSAACFALTCEQFARDYLDEQQHEYRHITGLIRDDLVAHALTVQRGTRTYRPAFTSAARMLRVPRRTMRLNRTAYTYDFPGYFLSHQHLHRLIRTLVRTGSLSDTALQQTIGVDGSHWMHRDTEAVVRPLLPRLRALTTYEGTFPKSTVTGAQLRDLIDEFVPDGPELKINPVRTWRRSIRDLVQALSIRAI